MFLESTENTEKVQAQEDTGRKVSVVQEVWEESLGQE